MFLIVPDFPDSRFRFMYMKFTPNASYWDRDCLMVVVVLVHDNGISNECDELV